MLKLYVDNWAILHRVCSYDKIALLVTFHLIFLFIDATSFSSAYFGQGTEPILLDNVRCSGSEAQLASCSYTTPTSSDYHYEDAGVRCTPG